MRIAVIGGGVSGLVATYLLQRAHDVELFEARATAGGHTNTVLVREASGKHVPLDVGFVVYSERTYPTFRRLLEELDVETRQSDMSFGVSCEDDGFEYSSRGLRGYLGNSRNPFNLRRAWMGLDVLRFQRNARSSGSASASRSVSPSRTSPPEMTAGGGRMRSSACAIVDLPLPDSPATPRISPLPTSSDTRSMARNGPRSVM